MDYGLMRPALDGVLFMTHEACWLRMERRGDDDHVYADASTGSQRFTTRRALWRYVAEHHSNPRVRSKAADWAARDVCTLYGVIERADD